jgi:hypothetical protein
MTIERAARYHRGNGQSVLAGKRDELRQRRRTDQPIQPRGMQRVHEDCGSQ